MHSTKSAEAGTTTQIRAPYTGPSVSRRTNGFAPRQPPLSWLRDALEFLGER
jgi:hypothetical protein